MQVLPRHGVRLPRYKFERGRRGRREHRRGTQLLIRQVRREHPRRIELVRCRAQVLRTDLSMTKHPITPAFALCTSDVGSADGGISCQVLVAQVVLELGVVP